MGPYMSAHQASKKANHEKKWYFYENQMPFRIPAGETVSGFIFANRSRGVRWVLVDVFSEVDAVLERALLEVEKTLAEAARAMAREIHRERMY